MLEETIALTVSASSYFLNLSSLCTQVYLTIFLPFSSPLCVAFCNGVKCDIVWDCKQPNRLFISVTPLRLALQRLFTPLNVRSTSENLMSTYYHSCTEASYETFRTYSMLLLNVLWVLFNILLLKFLKVLKTEYLHSAFVSRITAVKLEDPYMMPEDVVSVIFIACHVFGRITVLLMSASNTNFILCQCLMMVYVWHVLCVIYYTWWDDVSGCVWRLLSLG